jgi:probable F420-dependent oxidoreductase
MKFVVQVPIDHINPKGAFQSGEGVRVLGAAIERAGIWGALLSEHPIPWAEWLNNAPGGHDTLDPFSSLAFLATVTTRLMVISNVVVLPYRNPFITAKAAATLQILSDNRFIMGAGVGYQKQEFEALGVAFADRGALTEEALETIRRIWQGGAVVKKGRRFNAVGNEPRPVPSPPPPIWLGGGAPPALERAARLGDGWMPYFTRPSGNPDIQRASISSTADLAAKVQRVHDMRAGFGRTTPFEIAVGLPNAPKTLPNAAETARIVETIHGLKAAGTTCLWTTLPVASRAAYLESLAWFGEQVIPACTA